MTLRISEKVIQELLICVAEYAGPVPSQYLKILKDCGGFHSVEWKRMAYVFAQIPYLDTLEEACFLAMKKGISDVEDFSQLVKEVETAEKRKKRPPSLLGGEYICNGFTKLSG